MAAYKFCIANRTTRPAAAGATPGQQPGSEQPLLACGQQIQLRLADVISRDGRADCAGSS